jgi:hypothetical protein
MASFIGSNETHDVAQAGCISRHGAHVTTRTLNQAAGVAEGLFVAPSGTAGLECISPTTAALVAKATGLTVFRPMSEDFDATHHYADNEAVAIMEEGHMYVACEGTCVADQPVFCRILTDGSANTVVGKVRADSDYPAGGVVITPSDPFDQVTGFSVRLSDGVVDKTFVFNSDATPTVAEVAAGLVALIDASTEFAATGSVTISITSTTGVVDVLALSDQLAITTPARAIRVPGAFFDASRTGAGNVEVRLNKING